MELKPTDKKLLAYIYHMKREPLTKIAKATNLSRKQVDYNINRYIKEGIIRKFLTVFDYSKFGYPYLASLFLKFERHSSVERFKHKLKESKNCISWGEVMGKYDLFLNLIFKNEKELNDYLAQLISDKTEPIADYLLRKPYFAELYPLKFLNSKESSTFLFVDYPSEKRKFDKTELEILKLLEKDGRIRLVELSNKLNISSELALYKLKKLYSDKVILGTRIQFNMSKLGYFFSVIMLQMKNMSESNIIKLKRFVKNHPHINSFTLSVTKPNCLLQVFHKTEEELRETIKQLENAIKDESFEMEILLISEEEEVINTLPFLK